MTFCSFQFAEGCQDDDQSFAIDRSPASRIVGSPPNGGASRVVAAILFLPVNASTANADPACVPDPANNVSCTVIVLQQPQFPDGQRMGNCDVDPNNKSCLVPTQGQGQGQWQAGGITPPPIAPPPQLATVAGEDVDVYDAKNEPDGAGQVVGILPVGTQVQPVGNCAPSSWCQVNGFTLPNGASTGWVWGHLQLP